MAAGMNLKAATKLPRMRDLLAGGCEVSINLDQDVAVQAHSWIYGVSRRFDSQR